MRPSFVLAALALLSHWSTAFAQVTIAPTSKMGEPLVATLAIPEVEGQKTSVTLTASDGIGFKQYGNEIPVWPSSGGKFWLQADVQTEIHGSRDVLVPGEKWPEDPADIKRETITFLVDRTTKTHRVEFEVEGDAPVPPPIPEPKPGSLGALVPAEARGRLAEFYGDWARTIRTTDRVKTTGQWRADHQESMAALQDVLTASGWSAINKPISDKIAAAVGLQDVTLDPAKREALAAALDSISREFLGG